MTLKYLIRLMCNSLLDFIFKFFYSIFTENIHIMTHRYILQECKNFKNFIIQFQEQ